MARVSARPLTHALLLVIVFAAFALTSAIRPSAAAAATPAPGTFGVNPGDLFRLPAADWDRHLEAMKSHGVEVVRMGAWWSDLEPGPPVNGVHTYSWSEIDPKVAAMARHGLRWEPLICFSATWDSSVKGDYNAPPAGTENMAAFAAALAKRYGPGGDFWRAHPELPQLPVGAYELWNEQNAPIYWSASPEKYADLYAAVRAAVHAVEPGARVVVGGLAATINDVMPAEDFVRRMLAHRPDLRGRLDAVGYHPYARDAEGVLASVSRFRAKLDAIAGPGIPLELTEIGWTTVDVSESQRAARLAEITVALGLSDCGVERISAYSWLGPELAASDREQWFGIVRKDASPKPTATAYAEAISRARASSSTVKVCGAPAGAPATDGQATNSGSDAGAKAATKKLRLRVKQSRKRGRLALKARCATECRIRVAVRSAKRASASRAGQNAHVSRTASRSHAVSVRLAKRLRRPGSRVRVKVTAIDADGHRTTRTKTVRVR